MKQNDIFVLDKCEITVDKKKFLQLVVAWIYLYLIFNILAF